MRWARPENPTFWTWCTQLADSLGNKARVLPLNIWIWGRGNLHFSHPSAIGKTRPTTRVPNPANQAEAPAVSHVSHAFASCAVPSW